MGAFFPCLLSTSVTKLPVQSSTDREEHQQGGTGTSLNKDYPDLDHQVEFSLLK